MLQVLVASSACKRIARTNRPLDGITLKKLKSTNPRKVLALSSLESLLFQSVYLNTISDYSKGFGGKFGVQTDRQDKSAVGWDHHEAPQKHESQTDHKVGFGGKFGVQTDRMDKSAVTFNDEPTKVGTTYTKVKPDIGSAKPSDLKAKFEQMV